MPGNTPRPSGDCDTPRTTRRSARNLVMSCPSNRIEPWATGRSPEIARIVVDLPAPFAPIRATISPSPTVRLMPCRAWMRPYSSVTLSSSSSIGGHSQVRGDDRRIVPHLGGCPLGDLLAELQHHDPVGHTHHQAHVVLDQQYGVAQVADPPDELEQVLLLGRVEAGRRLVQAEQLRLGGQRPGDLQASLV